MATTANRQPLKRLAGDVPTGLDLTSGLPGETVQADYCATFVAQKTGFQNSVAKKFLGKVSVIYIGFTPHQLPVASTLIL